MRFVVMGEKILANAMEYDLKSSAGSPKLTLI